ncbi:alcohol dehydrogenase catalytic domain-containing protein [Bacillus sp. ISL-75]|uniref:zinc-dependent alcohol dehydrogenase n=1 Tax=Bacillus sp. ISL-75 TaxID=2819137 RepID=UPI001BE9EB53|nr:alcohol dehydrogenase catalytic domain-containing protein [Bacillus sp. ISL-75]MBT2727448.1 alcohol dehydrogenase catalytic domain-containing protein [Bacillus sp. ISL-75]
MKALMKTEPGFGNLNILDIPEPVCDATGIKIRVRYSGICGTDMHIYHDSYKSYPPVVIGHEFSGEVVESGKNVKNINPGDIVMVLPSIAWTCKNCMYCKQGYYMFCSERRSLGSGVNGSFTKYVVVTEEMVYKVPSTISLQEAALAEPLACAVQAIEELTEFNAGDWVLLSGPGPIGLISLSLLLSKGCNVIVTGTSQDITRLNIAKELGAHTTVDVFTEDLHEIIEELTDGVGVDIAVECSGAPSAVNHSIKALKKLGKYIQIGIVGSTVEMDIDSILYKQIQIFGSFAHSMQTWEKVKKILSTKTIDLKPIITDVIPLSEWERAFEIIESRECGKVLMYYDYKE